MGSAYCVNWFTTERQTFSWQRRGWNGGAEVARTTVKWLYAAGFDALIKRWDNYINVGGYVEKQTFFFQVRISHVLRFTSICDLFTDTPSYTKSAHMSLVDHPISQPSFDSSPIWVPIIAAEVRKLLHSVEIMGERSVFMLVLYR
jgi:hypothetical protein